MPSPAQAITTYYRRLEEIESTGAHHEGATRSPFQVLLDEWSRPHDLTLITEYSMRGKYQRVIRFDGALVNPNWPLPLGIWEAKDRTDNLDRAITQKVRAGYPLHNTLFENTELAILFQDGHPQPALEIRHDRHNLERVLDEFVSYRPPVYEEFHQAVDRFRADVPLIAAELTRLLNKAKEENSAFRNALIDLLDLCRSALNPATTMAEVEDMLKQHLLTERIFRSVFQNSDFVRRNAVAAQLERVVAALTSRSFSRDAFLQQLDYFYRPIEETARTQKDYEAKRIILNFLYERFFQAYSTRAADTHGIVYTPPEIVTWMVRSVEQALRDEFRSSLSAKGVHIIDPCVGTGTFMMEILDLVHHTAPLDFNRKYQNELFANEVLLLPYYIAAQNIEHAYLERTGIYMPFEGLCFADTLDLTEGRQSSMFAELNTRRIERQKGASIEVIIGNPPYNAWQGSANDNNQNRKHPLVDKRVQDTYARASRASNKNALSDVYVKFFRWATDRLGDHDGIICFVSNSSFVRGVAFDGMRQQLMKEFTRIYTLDLAGNVRQNPKLTGTKYNVFGIQVGVAITLLIRNRQHTSSQVFYAGLDAAETKEEKLKHLADLDDYTQVQWEELTPDTRGNWLTEGMDKGFNQLLPLGSKEARGGLGAAAQTIFKTYSRGVATSRDDWVYDFQIAPLQRKVESLIRAYNSEVDRWWRRGTDTRSVDEFVQYEDAVLKWSRDLKRDAQRGRYAVFDPTHIRRALYRPFCRRYLFFDRVLNEEIYNLDSIYPTAESERDNRCICLTGIGSEKPFMVLLTDRIPDLHLVGPGASTQCFPFYTYTEDRKERLENITDWALNYFQNNYQDATLTKWDIFYYIYAILHSPTYCAHYAENLKRELPHIPRVATPVFRSYVESGRQLAYLHCNYVDLEPYSLHATTQGFREMLWSVDERGMRLSKDRTTLQVSAGLLLEGIPPQVFDYRLGSRSALEWVIDQYRVTTDVRSGIRQDPNDPADSEAIIRLVGQVVQVSVETVRIIEALPPLEIAG